MFRTIVVFTLLLILEACHTSIDKNYQPEKQSAIEVIYSSQQCGRNKVSPSATWIDNQEQLEVSIKQIQRGVLGGDPINLPKPDFQNEMALLVEMGQKPTSGYQLELIDDGLYISQNHGYLTLKWVVPSKDSLLAQVISSPCLLLKLKRGDYKIIRVLDDAGVVRVSTSQR
jgi:hypothetical protein